MLLVRDDSSLEQFATLLKAGGKVTSIEDTPSLAKRFNVELLEGGNLPVLVFQKYAESAQKLTTPEPKKEHNPLIFGKDQTERIVAAETDNEDLVLYKEYADGRVEEERRPNEYWILTPKNYEGKFTRLEGDQHYRFIKTYRKFSDFQRAVKHGYNFDIFKVWDDVEASFIRTGITLFKGMKVSEVSVLSFDIESTGITHNEDSKVLLISNSFRRNGKTIRKLFAYDDYETEAGLFDAWCDWVQEIDPAIIVGHNIYCYDLPYLKFCAEKAGTKLRLGRGERPITVSSRETKFRKDQSQFYTYNKTSIFGRNVIDTFFLSMKYDAAAKKYETYGLKQIIKQEGLEVQDRQFYDASQIHAKYKDPVEWSKIKKYAIHDADDALALFDLMIPSYFYMTQSIPKTLEAMNNSATGSQINAFLIRSYLQDGYSIPKGDTAVEYEGGISFGNPGIYHNVFKVDVASLYPSIMRQFKVFDAQKDPKGHFFQMVEHFTLERLANKKKAKDTGDTYFKDLQESMKIVINSAYGMLGTKGLNFNSPKNAEFVTAKGREFLQAAMTWAESNGYKISNGDTDSISFCRSDMGEISLEERKRILADLNSQFPELISWEDDGYFFGVLIVKAKNYVLWDGTKLKIKGSGLKGTMKEPALQEFMKEMIRSLLGLTEESQMKIFNRYIYEIHNVKDISRWCFKKTITESVLDPKRTNEQKILDAIDKDAVQEGDKIYLYFDKEKNLKLREEFNNDHDTNRLLKKLYSSLEIFETVIDITTFPKYHNKKQQALLQNLLDNMH